MSKTTAIDEVFHVCKWRNNNYLLTTSHSDDIVLEWLDDNVQRELEVRV